MKFDKQDRSLHSLSVIDVVGESFTAPAAEKPGGLKPAPTEAVYRSARLLPMLKIKTH
jgi:hypothetical protein